MMTLPSSSVVLSDGAGAQFGLIRLVVAPPGPKPPRGAPTVKGDCIFDITPNSEAQDARQEVRWLFKRRFEARGEHKFKVTEDGVLTVTQADFKVVFDVLEEGGLRSRPPAPKVFGRWASEG
jgi:hypothetical protein